MIQDKQNDKDLLCWGKVARTSPELADNYAEIFLTSSGRSGGDWEESLIRYLGGGPGLQSLTRNKLVSFEEKQVQK